MDEKKEMPVIPIGIAVWEGLMLCVFAERIMESAENDFKLYKAKAEDTSCLVSWYYARKAKEAFNVWQRGWILTTNFKKSIKKQKEDVSEKIEVGGNGPAEKEEKAKVRKPNSRSKRSKVCE